MLDRFCYAQAGRRIVSGKYYDLNLSLFSLSIKRKYVFNQTEPRAGPGYVINFLYLVRRIGFKTLSVE